MEWQDIKTAPKDGSLFLVWDGPVCRYGLCFWKKEQDFGRILEKAHWHTINSFGNKMQTDPKLWQPLPESPK